MCFVKRIPLNKYLNGEYTEITEILEEDIVVFKMVAKHNVYLVRPERNPIVWGRNTGRYSSKKASDIASSSNLMGEGFFIYGFGAMWMPDPSKFVMIELKNRYSGIR